MASLLGRRPGTRGSGRSGIRLDIIGVRRTGRAVVRQQLPGRGPKSAATSACRTVVAGPKILQPLSIDSYTEGVQQAGRADGASGRAAPGRRAARRDTACRRRGPSPAGRARGTACGRRRSTAPRGAWPTGPRRCRPNARRRSGRRRGCRRTDRAAAYPPRGANAIGRRRSGPRPARAPSRPRRRDPRQRPCWPPVPAMSPVVLDGVAFSEEAGTGPEVADEELWLSGS